MTIPLDHDPGEAQVDWGEALVYLDGHLTRVYLFHLRLCYSQRPFVMAFLRQSQEAFFAGHVAAFEELGGVPRVITYDNLSLAVKRVLSGSRREEQQELQNALLHWLQQRHVPCVVDGRLISLPPWNDTARDRRMFRWPGYHTEFYDVDVRH